ncbi:MAG: DMT family transporter [Rhodospirillaceae bacterium]|mgnify:CR=1 FL=1|jgi:drug/metabolite transporter (DMT)-like permease|nr:DMT family transporter [Rhodospirillaceae bacterium]MBT5944380.1 DMT family transporter [Rhodospirillaceae bacterium]MBT6404731.1 DMT family transporter [Rhodospirillaceae bacterium]MBT6536340.1 DMT family transporter [Rhodospirillaceae bacterium]MBT7360662.1 DMT family transporter [Rhodospirillaceae bacterium]
MSNAQDSRFRQGLWPYAMILAAAFILASNHIIGRWVQGDMPPMGIGFWRLFIATAVLMPFAGRSVWAKRGLLRQHWKLFVVMAVALGPFGNAAVYVAYHFTTAINGGVVSTAQPVATVLITFFLFKESITRVQTLGIVLATVGVFVIISRGDLAILAALKPNIGDLIMLAAMFGFAVHNSLLRKIPSSFTTAEILLSVQCFSMLVMLPLYVTETIVFKPMPVTWEAAAVMAWVGIGVAIIAVGFTNTSILALGANKATISNYIRAIITAGLAILILGERLDLFHLVAFAFVVAGVVMLGRGRRVRAA